MIRRFVFGLLFASALISPAQVSDPNLQFADPVVLGAIQSNKLVEGSGIAVSSLNPNVFWTHNDGARDQIYAFRMDGALMATYKMNKSPSDVEDIATGPGPEAGARYLYIGDIGSNSAVRDTVRIYRVKEPAIDPTWATNPVSKDFKNVDTCHLHYPDGTFNAEALLLDPIEGAIFIATKEPAETRIYRAGLGDLQDGVTTELQFVRSLSMSPVSGGAVSADGSFVALRREDYAIAWHRNSGESMAALLSRPETAIPVVGPGGGEPNGEGISFLPDNSGYVTLSEGLFQPVYYFRHLAPCAQRPEFTALPSVQPDGIHLVVSSCPSTLVIIQKSTDLANWQDAGSVQVTASPANFIDPVSASVQYYRLRQSP